MTYMQAAVTVLSHAECPLTIGEITSVAVAHGLVRPRGRTPDRTMSSILYRRMAADPDAPVLSRGGRFWLRGRPLPLEETGYLGQRARRARAHAARRPSQGSQASQRAFHPAPARRVGVLPPPPLRLPDEALQAVPVASHASPYAYAPTRRERAVARAGHRSLPLLTRLEARRTAEGALLDVTRTDTRLVAPLLAHLGYRRGAARTHIERAGRGVTAHLLQSEGVPLIALLVRRLSHDLGSADAWQALGHARQYGAPYAAVTNGRELYLYSAAIAEAHDDVATALALTLDLRPSAAGSVEREQQAAAFWLLSRDSVASGALDSFVAGRAIGAVLLGALDAPDSPLARMLVSEAHAYTGVSLPADVVLRHVRLALRNARGRDGEPLPADVAAVAAVSGPRLEIATAAAPMALGA